MLPGSKQKHTLMMKDMDFLLFNTIIISFPFKQMIFSTPFLSQKHIHFVQYERFRLVYIYVIVSMESEPTTTVFSYIQHISCRVNVILRSPLCTQNTLSMWWCEKGETKEDSFTFEMLYRSGSFLYLFSTNC